MIKITPITNIPDLFAQLPKEQINGVDMVVLQAIKHLTHTLRTSTVDTESTGWLFPPEVCSSFAKELNEALAQIIRMRIPRAPSRPVGRPRSAAVQEAKTDAQAAKDAKKAHALASNTFKARILNLVDTLRACAQRMELHCGAETDPVVRGKLTAPAVNPVRAAFVALEEAVPDDAALIEAVKDMSANVTKFERAVDNWINSPHPAIDKNDGLHKSRSINDWIDACRALARANALYLQRIK